MSDLIDRNEVIKKLEQLDLQDLYLPLHFLDMVINEIPIVDAEPVRHGYWIVKKTAIGAEYTICSECKTDFKFKTDKGTFARLDMRGVNYCPNCGLKCDL